jgi:hypothetical protein
MLAAHEPLKPPFQQAPRQQNPTVALDAAQPNIGPQPDDLKVEVAARVILAEPEHITEL